MRFRYWTDVAATEPGIKVDNIALNGTLIGTAEADEGWTFDGFVETTGAEMQSFFNAYVVENRQYDGYDQSLRTAYNFGFLTTTPDVTFTILPGTTPELHPVELVIAPFLFVRVVATQSATGGDLAAAISLDFVGKE